jgi:hypothetical protein
MKSLGMLLLIAGCVTSVIGLVLLLAPKIPWLGYLPRDIHHEGKNASFHFPVVTCIVVSSKAAIWTPITSRIGARSGSRLTS